MRYDPAIPSGLPAATVTFSVGRIILSYPRIYLYPLIIRNIRRIRGIVFTVEQLHLGNGAAPKPDDILRVIYPPVFISIRSGKGKIAYHIKLIRNSANIAVIRRGPGINNLYFG